MVTQMTGINYPGATSAGVGGGCDHSASAMTALWRPLTIDAVCERIDEVSTLPYIALEVIRVARDPDAGAADLCAIVEGDPALSSRVLKCVNSAAYGMRNRVSNLQRAISMLGFKQVRNLAITASVSKVFRNNESLGPYTRPALWRHMVSVAIVSRMIATRCEVAAFEEAFLAGLLHDIGIILEDQYCHDHFARAMQTLDGSEPLVQVEARVIGFDHTLIGARYAEAARFPEEAEAAIRFHHDFAAYRGSHSTIVASVVLANMLCTLCGYPSVGMKLVECSTEAMDTLKVSRKDLKVWAVDLSQELNQNSALFNL